MPKTSIAVGVTIGAALAAGYDRVFSRAEDRVRALGASVREARKRQAAAHDVVQYRKKLQTLKRLQAEAGGESERFAERIEKTRRALARAIRQAERYGIEVGSAAAAERRAADEAARHEAALARIERRRRNREVRRETVGKALAVGGSLYGLGRLFQAAFETERAAVRLGTVINAEDRRAALAKARAEARTFAREGLSTETQVLDIQYALNSAGLEAEAARVGARVVAKVATVTSGMPEQVGEVIATTFNNLGDRLEGGVAERLARIGDLLAKTQFKFQIRDFGQLGESLKYATPALASFNVALDQGLTLLGALNSAGLQGSMAGTALAAAFAALPKAVERFGVALTRNEKGELDFIDIVGQIGEAVGGFENMSTEAIDTLTQTFGTEGVRAVLLLGRQLEALRAAQRDVAEGSKGIVDESYRAFLESAPGQVERLRNNLTVLGSVVAGAFFPAINDVLPTLTDWVGRIGSLIESMPAMGSMLLKTTVVVTALAATFVVGRVAATLFSDALIVGRGVLVAFRLGAAAAVAATRVLALALRTTPIGLAVSGLALAAGLIVANWQKVKAFFTTIWDGVKPYWEKFAAFVGSVWDSISAPFRAVGKLVGAALGIGRNANRSTAPAQTASAVSAAVAATPAPVRQVVVEDRSTIEINVHQREGEDAEGLARRVAEALRQARREDAGAALYDLEPGV